MKKNIKLLSKLSKQDTKEENEVKSTIEHLKNADVSILEDTKKLINISRIHFILSKHPEIPVDKIPYIASSYAWIINKKETEFAIKILKKAKLI